MRILVTGVAGFIGFHTAKRLLENGHEVIGIDNLNDYYPSELKIGRLRELGISIPTNFFFDRCKKEFGSALFNKFKFIYSDISSLSQIEPVFSEGRFDAVCNLAAQAGVRYSFQNPFAYVQSNIVGFVNILELCRKYDSGHLVYASSSSVYGNNNKVPFCERDCVDKPQSLYAATKKSDELMAYVYSTQLGLPTTGLRFFTVYGPWGRPDMAPFIFMKSILEGKTIKVFNNGNLNRDFSYIDDIVTGTVKIIESESYKDAESEKGNSISSNAAPCKIYNIGNSRPVKLMDFISTIEDTVEKKAIKEFVGMQIGDVYTTYADTTAIEQEYGFKPNTPLEYGIKQFYKWYKNYFI